MPVELFTPPPGWKGVDATLLQLRASTGALGEFLERQWDELESVRLELASRARDLEHRQRELARKEEELAGALELAKLRAELAEARCELASRPPLDPDETDEVVATPIRIAEMAPEHNASNDSAYRRPAMKIPG